MGKPGALYRETQRKELRQKDTMQEFKTAFKGSTAGSWITFGDDFFGQIQPWTFSIHYNTKTDR